MFQNVFISLSHWSQCGGHCFLLTCFLPFSFLLTHSVPWPHSSRITSLGNLWDSYCPFLGLFTLDGTGEGSSLLHWHPLRKRLQCAWLQESSWRLENQVTTWVLEGRPSVHQVLKLVSLLEHHRKVPWMAHEPEAEVPRTPVVLYECQLAFLWKEIQLTTESLLDGHCWTFCRLFFRRLLLLF